MDKIKLISVSSIAEGGKDTLFHIIQKKYPQFEFKNIKFANQLRNETYEILEENFGYNVFSEDREQKEKFRNFLVLWADMKRKQNPQHYLNYIKYQLKHKNKKNIYVLTDLRFAQAEYDEINFCLENGPVIHIEKYFLDKNNNKVFQPPPNRFEAENDPKIKNLSTHHIVWNH